MSNYIVNRIDPDFAPETHTLGASSAQSSAITTGAGLIRIAVTTGTHIKFGSNPTATIEDVLIPANNVEIFSFSSGQKIAFIQSSAGGVINICALD